MQRKRLVQPVSSSNGRHEDYELDYRPRNELLAQLVRSSRLVLTFRGFASFVVLLALYLVVANTLQLVELQAIEGDAQEMLPTTVHHVHPSLLGRRASADRRAGKLKTPPPPPEPPSPPLRPEDSGNDRRRSGSPRCQGHSRRANPVNRSVR